jgi:hypothetical protein
MHHLNVARNTMATATTTTTAAATAAKKKKKMEQSTQKTNFSKPTEKKRDFALL